MSRTKNTMKNILGDLPWAPELYWHLRQPGKPLTANFSMEKLQKALPELRHQAENASTKQKKGKQLLLFGTLRYWIEHVTLLSLALGGLGHKVTLSYLPYAKWQTPVDRFNLRRHNVYAQNVLKQAEPALQVLPLLTAKKVDQLPPTLEEAIYQLALRDTQYTLQVEEVDLRSELHQLRLERNLEAARAMLSWLQANRPDGVIIPNGTIMEFGALYQTARYLNIPVVTYEFGEQRQRIWLAHDREVMHQETDALWTARKNLLLSEEQLNQVRDLFASRQRASLWENFARRWQGVPSEGGEKAREGLGLDQRPVVLLATNVIGDSLTLGRQVFSDSMTEWLKQTIQFFARHPEAQLVVRIHPGELITKGPSVADVARQALALIPENIHLIPADAKVNTYDLVEIADLGLVYTTTVGMEMAMSGVPVIVVGNTHYRHKGFTLDPATWPDYFDLMVSVLKSPQEYRLSKEHVDQAWNYAYRFFFEYPHPFPWHVVRTWTDLEEWSITRVLSEEGQSIFGKTFAYLAGTPVNWST